eukprot:5684931-Amphidinium_carterae.2
MCCRQARYIPGKGSWKPPRWPPKLGRRPKKPMQIEAINWEAAEAKIAEIAASLESLVRELWDTPEPDTGERSYRSSEMRRRRFVRLVLQGIAPGPGLLDHGRAGNETKGQPRWLSCRRPSRDLLIRELDALRGPGQ